MDDRPPEQQSYSSSMEAQPLPKEDGKKRKSGVFWTLTMLMMAGTGFGLGLAGASIETLSHTLADNIAQTADKAQCSAWEARQFGISQIAVVSVAAILGLWYWLMKSQKIKPLFTAVVMVLSAFLISGAAFSSLFAYLHSSQMLTVLQKMVMGGASSPADDAKK